MTTRATFTWLPLMHWTSVLMLLGSGAVALSGFMALSMAMAGAAVLTFLLKVFAEQASNRFAQRRYVTGMLFGAGAAGFASVTVALSAATLYGAIFATPSAVADWTARREPAEREMQRVLALAGTAQSAMADWAKDASAKAVQEGDEHNGGGSCPSLPASGNKRGPVTKWREDDATIARSLADELKTLTDAAASSTATLVAQPKPSDFAGVKAGYEAANKASDDITRLTGGGSYAKATVQLLEGRRTSQIERSGQPAASCGDTARLTFIERATVALNALADLKPMPRMQPGIDVSDRNDVLSRSLLRSTNSVLSMATLGRAGNFNGDHLMQQALKQNGVVNIETLAMLIAVLAEVMVVTTSVLMARQGHAPFKDNLVTWIDADEQAHANPGTARRLARSATKRIANLFFTEPEDEAQPKAAAHVLPATPRCVPTSGVYQLPDDPRLSRVREEEFADTLLQHHVPWGNRDFLLIPVDPETVDAERKAEVLVAVGMAEKVTAAAPTKVLRAPEAATRLLHMYGPEWARRQFQIFLLNPAYAHLMRLRAIAGATTAALAAGPAAAAVAAVAQPGSGGYGTHFARHVPLSHRLAQRPSMRRTR